MKTLIALAVSSLALVSQSAFAMPHDQPERTVYKAGKIQVQLYRSEGLAGSPKGEESYRALTDILICKNGKAVKNFSVVREIGANAIGLSKTGGVVLNDGGLKAVVSIELPGLKIDDLSLKLDADASGIHGFEIKSERFGQCAKAGDGEE